MITDSHRVYLRKLEARTFSPFVNRCLTLPPELIPLINGHLHWMTQPWLWEGSGPQNDAMRNAVYQVMEQLTLDCEDVDQAQSCLDYLPNSGLIKFFPSDPNVDPEFFPGLYASPPWQYKGADVEFRLDHLLPGYAPSDFLEFAVGLLNNFNFDLLEGALASGVPTSWNDFMLSEFNLLPRYRVQLDGVGEVEIHHLKNIQGGTALVVPDGNVTKVQTEDLFLRGIDDFDGLQELFVTVGQNILGTLAGGFFDYQITEVIFDTPGPHTIDVVMLPWSRGTIGPFPVPILAWGGGLRKITVCDGINAVFTGVQRPRAEDYAKKLPSGYYEVFTGERGYIVMTPASLVGDCDTGADECSDECGCGCGEDCENMGCKCIEDIKIEGGKLYVRRCGCDTFEFNSLVGISEEEFLPTPAEDETPARDYACAKARGVSEAIADFLPRWFNLSPIRDRVLFTLTHPGVKTRFFAFDNLPWLDLEDEENKYNAEGEDYLDEFQIAMSNTISNGSTLNDSDIELMRAYDFSTGLDGLNNLFEGALDVLQGSYLKQWAARAVSNGVICDDVDPIQVNIVTQEQQPDGLQSGEWWLSNQILFSRVLETELTTGGGTRYTGVRVVQHDLVGLLIEIYNPTPRDTTSLSRDDVDTFPDGNIENYLYWSTTLHDGLVRTAVVTRQHAIDNYPGVIGLPSTVQINTVHPLVIDESNGAKDKPIVPAGESVAAILRDNAPTAPAGRYEISARAIYRVP